VSVIFPFNPLSFQRTQELFHVFPTIFKRVGKKSWKNWFLMLLKRIDLGNVPAVVQQQFSFLLEVNLLSLSKCLMVNRPQYRRELTSAAINKHLLERRLMKRNAVVVLQDVYWVYEKCSCLTSRYHAIPEFLNEFCLKGIA
jgi:hypothetical protein